MIAYKFLRTGAEGPFTGFRWPVPVGADPGDWVVASQPLDVCRSGIHGCAPAFLSYWINDELWVMEFGEPVLSYGSVLVASQGRLLRQVTSWGPQRRGFAEACTRRICERAAACLRDAGRHREAEELGEGRVLEEIGIAAARIARDVPDPAATAVAYAADAARYTLEDKPQTVAFIAAHAAGFADGDAAAASEAERAWQGGWLSRRLQLEGA